MVNRTSDDPDLPDLHLPGNFMGVLTNLRDPTTRRALPPRLRTRRPDNVATRAGTGQTWPLPLDSLLVLNDQRRQRKFRHTGSMLVTGRQPGRKRG
jgi:hypothetical protein